MKITAVLCTYNRSEKLATVMDSLAASVFPESDEWEVLVVDNNSPDETRAVVETFVRRDPRHFRYLFEAQQGKSHALNAGVREARGEIVAFVDDDVTVEPNWLYNLTSDLGRGEWVGSGGRILLPPGISLPRWLAIDGPWRQTHALCAHFDLGDVPGELKEAPYGTNMAFRKELFSRYGYFRTDLGPRPGSEIRNEDTELGKRVLAGGERLRYVPSAVVYHPVPAERVRKGYFRARWFAFGRAEIRETGSAIQLRGIPRYCLRNLRVLVRQTGEWLRTRDPKERFGRQCAAYRTAGAMAEVCSRALKRQPAPAADSVSESRTLS